MSLAYDSSHGNQFPTSNQSWTARPPGPRPARPPPPPPTRTEDQQPNEMKTNPHYRTLISQPPIIQTSISIPNSVSNPTSGSVANVDRMRPPSTVNVNLNTEKEKAKAKAKGREVGNGNGLSFESPSSGNALNSNGTSRNLKSNQPSFASKKQGKKKFKSKNQQIHVVDSPGSKKERKAEAKVWSLGKGLGDSGFNGSLTSNASNSNASTSNSHSVSNPNNIINQSLDYRTSSTSQQGELSNQDRRIQSRSPSLTLTSSVEFIASSASFSSPGKSNSKTSVQEQDPNEEGHGSSITEIESEESEVEAFSLGMIGTSNSVTLNSNSKARLGGIQAEERKETNLKRNREETESPKRKKVKTPEPDLPQPQNSTQSEVTSESSGKSSVNGNGNGNGKDKEREVENFVDFNKDEEMLFRRGREMEREREESGSVGSESHESGDSFDSKIIGELGGGRVGETLLSQSSSNWSPQKDQNQVVENGDEPSSRPVLESNVKSLATIEKVSDKVEAASQSEINGDVGMGLAEEVERRVEGSGRGNLERSEEKEIGLKESNLSQLNTPQLTTNQLNVPQLDAPQFGTHQLPANPTRPIPIPTSTPLKALQVSPNSNPSSLRPTFASSTPCSLKPKTITPSSSSSASDSNPKVLSQHKESSSSSRSQVNTATPASSHSNSTLHVKISSGGRSGASKAPPFVPPRPTQREKKPNPASSKPSFVSIVPASVGSRSKNSEPQSFKPAQPQPQPKKSAASTSNSTPVVKAEPIDVDAEPHDVIILDSDSDEEIIAYSKPPSKNDRSKEPMNAFNPSKSNLSAPSTSTSNATELSQVKQSTKPKMKVTGMGETAFTSRLDLPLPHSPRHLLPISSRGFESKDSKAFDSLLVLSPDGIATTSKIGARFFGKPTSIYSSTISKAHPPIVEDVLRVSTKAVAVASSCQANYGAQPPQLTLLFAREPSGRSSDSNSDGNRRLATDELEVSPIRHLKSKPHTFGPSCLSLWPFANGELRDIEGGERVLELATGGSDGVVFRWAFNSKSKSKGESSDKATRVHALHVSSAKASGVTALTDLKKCSTLVSAGTDGKIVLYDVDKQAIRSSWETSDKVVSLQKCPSPHLLLSAQSRIDFDQFKCFVSGLVYLSPSKPSHSTDNFSFPDPLGHSTRHYSTRDNL